MKMNKTYVATFVLAASIGSAWAQVPARQPQTTDSQSPASSERTQSDRARSGDVAAGQAAQQRENLQGTPQSAPGSAQRINTSVINQISRDFYKNVHIRGSKLIGWKVVDESGKDLGKISDVAIGPGGRIDALVIKVGGIIGIGEKEYTIPWSAVAVESTKDPIRVMVSRADVEKALPVEGDPLGASLTFKDQELNKRFDVEGTSSTLATPGPGTGTATIISPAKPMDEQAQQSKFTQYDRNNDGYISKNEARNDRGLNAAFGRLDSNRDNRLDESEFARFEAPAATMERSGGTQGGSRSKDSGGTGPTSDAQPGTTAVPHSQEGSDPGIHRSGGGAGSK